MTNAQADQLIERAQATIRALGTAPTLEQWEEARAVLDRVAGVVGERRDYQIGGLQEALYQLRPAL